MLEEFDYQNIEPYLRLGSFLSVLVLVMLFEYLLPRREKQFRRERWPSNLAIVTLNTVMMRVIVPAATVLTALWAEQNGVGVLNVLSLPGWLNMMIAVVLLDLLIYWQHRWFHLIPVLWRVHSMHHSDTMIDVTTGTRFHPVEIFASLGLKSMAIVLMGAPVWSVIIFEVLLNAAAMFNHSNIKLPVQIDAKIRKVLVTPDMHRVHHSVIPDEHHSNFGFSLSIWDYLFGSYRAQPKDGHEHMLIGLNFRREAKEKRLPCMLAHPFRAWDEAYNTCIFRNKKRDWPEK